MQMCRIKEGSPDVWVKKTSSFGLQKSCPCRRGFRMKNLSELNSTALPPPPLITAHNFPALIFGIFLIIVIICGNVLVCLSVWREKALKTTTNYFIVSLAAADLLLAVLVLPLFVYAEMALSGILGHYSALKAKDSWKIF
ncbi:hypothetical protein PDJAM_G00023660 [Pangasius djambal]|uniref:Uncharacterized protein n=1 Tax=Pangasius djambal TaxID=1691987 RepID=A0ACC5YNW0_9TELE|nr:hypothetical protein [Pangasius djambal]